MAAVVVGKGDDAEAPVALEIDPALAKAAMEIVAKNAAEEGHAPTIPWKPIAGVASLAGAFFVGKTLFPELFMGDASTSGGFDLQLDKNIPDSIWTSFLMIMATEVGDETFIIAAVMSMRHNKLVVLGGALGALYFMTVLSALLGVVLPNLISETTVRSCATVLYIFFGLRLMWIGAKGEEEDKDEEFEEVEQKLDRAETNSSVCKQIGQKMCSAIFLEALILTFLAEWGDRSQIATITLAAHQNPIGVVIGACIGHTICTSLAVFLGEWLGKRVSSRFIAFTGGLLFMFFAFLNQVYGI